MEMSMKCHCGMAKRKDTTESCRIDLRTEIKADNGGGVWVSKGRTREETKFMTNLPNEGCLKIGHFREAWI